MKRKSSIIQRIFGISDLDEKSILDRFRDSLNLANDPELLQTVVLSYFHQTFGIPNSAIALADEEGEVYTITSYKGIEPSNVENLLLTYESPLIKWLNINRSMIRFSSYPEVVNMMSEAEQRFLNESRIHLCVPLTSINRMIGVIFLGGKGNKEHFSNKEIEIINLLTGHAALAIKNTYLHRAHKEQKEQLHRADKLRIAGQLAAGVAHEIRNPLTSIRSTIQFLQKSTPKEDSKWEYLGDILEEVDRINNTVEGLLSVVRPTEPQLVRVDLNQIIQDDMKLLAGEFKKYNIEIETDLDQRTSEIVADPSQIKQVLLNVLINATHAMPDGGKLFIQTKLKTTDIRMEHLSPFMAVLKIQDSGEGISEENLSRIFDPFFTTKKSGTGLGLAITHSIIERHSGTITYESTEGEGTTVTIRLPLHKM